ncbi:serine hydrolase FSH [Hypoxylon fuscum]|nr:serine hydrolase FSH [Hypoxylon fuscum]
MAQTSDAALPVILCIHGHGHNGAIFRYQAKNIIQILGTKFRFVFVESPIEVSQPAIGVLPFFADFKPFRRWHHDESAVGQLDVTAEDVVRERNLVRNTIAECIEKEQPVGVMAFSHGTRVATALCLDPELGANIKFAIMFCGFAGASPLTSGLEPRTIDMPSIYAQGSLDPWGAKAKQLSKSHFVQARLKIVKFRGGHELPTQRADVVNITKEILLVWDSVAAH